MEIENKKIEPEKKEPTGKTEVKAIKTPKLAPTGIGRFKDTVMVFGTEKNPRYAGKKYKVHTSQVEYLLSKGYINKPEAKSEKSKK